MGSDFKTRLIEKEGEERPRVNPEAEAQYNH